MSNGLTLGAQFAAAREARGLPLEKAAHETRIRVQRLREIENDDLSHFSHPSYARMFLIDYAKYLGIPVNEIRDFLPAPGVCGTEGYQYLQESEERVVYRPIRPARQRRLVPALVGAMALIACLVGGFQLFVTLRKLDRIELGKATVAPAAVPVEPAEIALSAEPKLAVLSPDSPTALSSAETIVTAPAPTSVSIVKLEESVVVSDADFANAESAPEAAPAAPAPTPKPAPLSNSQQPGSPLFVGGTVEHGSSVQ